MIKCPRLHQGDERQLDTRRIAPRAGDQRRLPDRLPRELGNRVDCLPEQLGSRVIPAIVVCIDLGLPEPEVGAQVDHHLARLQRGRGILGGDTMRQSQEDDAGITGGYLRGLGLGEDQSRNLQAREPRHHLSERLACMLA